MNTKQRTHRFLALLLCLTMVLSLLPLAARAENDSSSPSVTAKITKVCDSTGKERTTTKATDGAVIVYANDQISVDISVSEAISGGTVSFTVDPAKLALKGALPSTNWSQATKDGTCTYTYTAPTTTEGASPIAQGSNLGTFTFTVLANRTDGAEAAIGDAKVAITKRIVSQPEAIASKTYNGEVQYPVVDAQNALYSVSNTGGKDVGSYDVTFTLKYPEYYRWENVETDSATLTKSFQITQATNEWTTQPEVTATTTSVTTSAAAKFGTVNVAYYKENPLDEEGKLKSGATSIEGTPTNVGTYYVLFSVEGNDNYTGLNRAVQFTINGTYTAPQMNSGLTYTVTDGKAAAQALITAGTFPENTDTDGVKFVYAVGDEKPTIEGSTATAIPTGTAAGNYKVWYKIVSTSSENYTTTDWIELGTVTISPAALREGSYELPKAANKLYYNGTKQNLVTMDAAKNVGLTVEYSTDGGTTWSTAIPQGTAPGNYTVEYKISKDNYQTVSGQVPVTSYEDGAEKGYSMVYVFTNGTARYGYQVTNVAGTTETKGMYDITALGYHVYLNDGDSLATVLTATPGYTRKDGEGWKVYAVPIEGSANKSNVVMVDPAQVDPPLTYPIVLSSKGAEDVNANSEIDLIDVAAILTSRNLDTNKDYLTTYAGTLFRADVNKDGTIDAAADTAAVWNAIR
jgi:hypothetical protein